MTDKLSKRAQALSALTSGLEPIVASETDGKKKPASAPGGLHEIVQARDEALDRAENAEAELASARTEVETLKRRLLDDQKEKGFASWPLEDFEIIPGCQRTLTPTQRAELKANLKAAGQAQPISYILLPNGKKGIWAGCNRFELICELHAEDGNHPTIDACYKEIDVAKARKLGFFSNLLHPDLPPYEKYLGLKELQFENPEHPLTQEQLEELTGITRTTIGALLKFEDLPGAAHELLRTKKDALGATNAAEMAKLVGAGKEGKVVEAIAALVRDGITEVEAMRIAREETNSQQSSGKTPAVRDKYKVGRESYCTLVSAGTKLSIDFKSDSDRATIEAMVRKFIETEAKAKRIEGK